MINDFRNETEGELSLVLFNTVFDRGRFLKIKPNQLIATCENCSITVVKDFEEAQSLYPDKEIEDCTIPIPPRTPPRTAEDALEEVTEDAQV